MSYSKGTEVGRRMAVWMWLEGRQRRKCPCQQNPAYLELMTELFFVLGSVAPITSVSFLLRNKYLIARVLGWVRHCSAYHPADLTKAGWLFSCEDIRCPRVRRSGINPSSFSLPMVLLTQFRYHLLSVLPEPLVGVERTGHLFTE